MIGELWQPDFLCQECEQNDVNHEHNLLRIDNKEAIGLYKKFDFVEISIRKGYYKGIDGILMERKVIR